MSLPNTDFFGEKKKTASFIPAKKSHGLGYATEAKKKKKMTYFPRFWVKEPPHSQKFSHQKCHHTSIVARARNMVQKDHS